MREFLQSYKIVMNIEQKTSKNKHLVRGFENTQENFFNFCREVGKVLCRSWAFSHEKFGGPTNGRFEY